MASQPKTLTKFTVAPKGEQFSVHVEDDAGEVIEFEASRDQLDVIAEHLEDMLDADDSADSVDGEDEEDEED